MKPLSAIRQARQPSTTRNSGRILTRSSAVRRSKRASRLGYASALLHPTYATARSLIRLAAAPTA